MERHHAFRRPLEVAFEWRLNRFFLRRTEAGAQSATEWIGWDPVQKALVSFRFGADGAVRAGDASFDGGALVVANRSDWLEGDPVTRATYRVNASGSLQVRVEAWREGAYAPAWEAALDRK